MPRPQRDKVSQARLKEVLDYDPATGIFTWRKQAGVKIGRRAGCIKPGTNWDGGGYRLIRVDYRLYRASHLAWLWVYGVWPTKILDHRDLNRAHDAIGNLREATHSENNVNGKAHSRNKLGIRGVSYKRKSGKYIAQLMKGGKQMNFGLYDTPEEAKTARDRAAVQHFGQFARTD